MTEPPADKRRRGTPRWFEEGEDPDYRFSLANERTFLAWIRTSLAMLAGAVALVQLVPAFRVAGARTALGAVLAATGLLVSVLAYLRWAENERAMRTRRSLPYTRTLLVVAAAVSLIGFAILLLALFAAR